jgi:hypothetical protein
MTSDDSIIHLNMEIAADAGPAMQLKEASYLDKPRVSRRFLAEAPSISVRDRACWARRAYQTDQHHLVGGCESGA